MGVVASALLLGAAPTGAVASASGGGVGAHYGRGGATSADVCSANVGVGYAHCLAHVRTDAWARDRGPLARGSRPPATTLGNNGAYDPSYLRSAYAAPSATGGAGQTVAIVDAYDDPRAESDMAYYRSYFGLPACTTAGVCFRKVNESGGSGSYPRGNSGWGQEISLDLDMVSAICPNCHIVLVEANTNSLADLGTAVNTAVKLGANVVTNSYGGGEYSEETSNATAYYEHPGVAITAASGDSGYGVEFPAASPTVTAVGGTSLYQATNTGTRNATEEAWSGAGSGCSAYEPEQGWQSALPEYTLAACYKRMVADVSAVANPSTGVWVYDTYSNPGFEIFGGTSASTQIVGAVYALADNSSASGEETSYPYGDPAALNYIHVGSNGSCGTYLCNAADSERYNGPTGLGTPNGAAAFAGSSTPPPPPPPSPSPPGAPQNLTAASSSAKGVALAWGAPTSNGGSAISGYVLYRSTQSGRESAYVSVTCTALACTYNDSNTRRGAIYYYTAAAVNTVGTGPQSNQASARAK